MDWTEAYSQKEIAKKADRLIEDLLAGINDLHLPAYEEFSPAEQALLLRFPIHVGVNIFLERMIRVHFQKQKRAEQAYPKVSEKLSYFKDTHEAVISYYHDFAINYTLFNRLLEIFGIVNADNKLYQSGKELPKPQKSRLVIRRFTPRAILYQLSRTIFNFYIRITKPKIIGEYSKWIKEFMPESRLFSFNYVGLEKNINLDIRKRFRDCFQKVFLRHIDSILGSLTSAEKRDLSRLFADTIDHILPISVVEGLRERYEYYKKLSRGWNLKQLHTFLGVYYVENFKLFAILAKRRKAVLISHDHGSCIPVSLFKFVKNELAFVDYFSFWGKNNSDWIMGDTKLKNLKIVNAGSVFLSNIKKWSKNRINSDGFTILYPSGPLMDFMNDLEAQVPEKTFRQRLEVLKMLKELIKKYPKLKILYKPFPATFTNDPIKKVFEKEFARGVVQLVKDRPANIFHQVDLVLWDMISTGFAESVQTGVPTLAFVSKYEYDRALPLGKELVDDFVRCGVAFFDAEAGIRSVDNIIGNFPEFREKVFDPINKYKRAVAYPVKRDEFLASLKEEGVF